MQDLSESHCHTTSEDSICIAQVYFDSIHSIPAYFRPTDELLLRKLKHKDLWNLKIDSTDEIIASQDIIGNTK